MTASPMDDDVNAPFEHPPRAGRIRNDAAPRLIFVDLDGTLARTDLFFESLVNAFKRRPLATLGALFTAFRRPARAKAVAARHGAVDAETLPYQQDFVDYLRAEKARGARLVLATAAHERNARRVARHLGLFDEVIATRRGDNVKGRRKLDRIAQSAQGRPFAYAGDARADAPIWAAADERIFVNAPRPFEAQARRDGAAYRVFRNPDSPWRMLIKAMRPHQWVKNLLIFAPLLTAHAYGDPRAAALALLAFISFSLCASGVYILNDLADLDSDRRHEKKRSRPFASGRLSPAVGAAAAPALFAAAFLVSLFISPAFIGALIVYAVATTLYSFWIKRKAALDVITLAGLFTIRVIAGGLAIGVALSQWLLAFSMFMFLSLAYLKRYSELARAGRMNKAISGRGYSDQDTETVFTLGAASGLVSVLVIALYLDSDFVAAEYPFPEALWLLGPAILYWINRIWIGARRGKVEEDPIVFAIKDRVSLAIGAFCVAVVLVAKYAPFGLGG